MAMGITYVCNSCSHEILAWDDGNPYYFDEAGKKRYAYHPDPKRDLCIGNDADVLCLECGNKFKEDLKKFGVQCSKCHSENIVKTYKLEGKPCPFCKTGIFQQDLSSFTIS